MELKKPTRIEYYYYKKRFFVGFTENNKPQFLHYNKKGYELQNGLSKKAVILKYDDTEDNKRFDTIASSPFKFCYKIDCLEHLYNIKVDRDNIFKKIVKYLRKIWSNN